MRNSWVIIACGKHGYWFLNRYHYSKNELDEALEEAAKFQAGIFKLAEENPIITVSEYGD